ncbi:cation transport protein-domain-containing protein [Melampsora americana]|nr:cation transport protein-domain-containing protein [Melampsora americana]
MVIKTTSSPSPSLSNNNNNSNNSNRQSLRAHHPHHRLSINKTLSFKSDQNFIRVYFNRARNVIEPHINFYRAHLLAFIFLPLLFGIIILLANKLDPSDSSELKPARFIDCIFMSYSAMTMTGLNTIPLASINRFQQVILYILMTIGSTTSVSIVMVVIRLRYFKLRFRHILSTRPPARPYISSPVDAHPLANICPPRNNEPVSPRTLNNDIQSVPQDLLESKTNETEKPSSNFNIIPESQPSNPKLNSQPMTRIPLRRNSDTELRQVSFSPARDLLHPTPKKASAFPRSFTLGDEPKSVLRNPQWRFPAVIEGARLETTATPVQVEFLIDDDQYPHQQRLSESGMRVGSSTSEGPRYRRPLSTGVHHGRTPSYASNAFSGNVPGTPLRRKPSLSSQRDFGGFPNPLQILLSRLIAWIRKCLNHQPSESNQNNLQFVRTTSLAINHTGVEDEKDHWWLSDVVNSIKKVKEVSYINFNAIVGRNSNFLTLTSAQEEELGGVEYRALSLLLKILIGYWTLLQFGAIIILLPWLETNNRYKPIFEGPGGTPIACFTNGGMRYALALLPPMNGTRGFTVFQEAYLLIFVCSFLILAGNTAFPIFLRFSIWALSKIAPSRPSNSPGSCKKEVLRFLLDHPRRCFVYLFPARQNWYLLGSILVLNIISWVAFLVLNIGNPEVEKISTGTRFLTGLLQTLSVRAAGFSAVSISALAPAVQVLYIIMMYVAVYPIAMSIRSTNVYEERSLGIFEQPGGGPVGERRGSTETIQTEHHNWWEGSRSYLSLHARQQLAFDIWWLFLALWIICIVERHQIISDRNPWFNVFSILFELVSAYGTIGLSLGVPFSPTSLCGQFSRLSKLVVILVMIRGRHRGLPLAIDRSILLPVDYNNQEEVEEEDQEEDQEEVVSRENEVGGQRV